MFEENNKQYINDKSVENCFKHSFKDNFSTDLSFCEKKMNLVNILDNYKDKNYQFNFPYIVIWEITSGCNLRCKHCFNFNNENKYDFSDDLSTEKILKFAEFFIEELNVIKFKITGGEPFLQKDILQILKYLKSKNVYVEIQTNGTLITKEIAKELGNILNSKTDFVQISLDGPNEKSNDKIRGKGSFNKITNALKYLKDNNVNTTISYTITSLNVDCIPSLNQLAKDLKIQNINLGRFKVCNENQQYLKPKLDDVILSVDSLLNKMDGSFNLNLLNFKTYDFLNYKIGKKLLDERLKQNKFTITNLMCHRHEKMTISGNGNVYFCPNTDLKELSLGNIDEQSFFDIWGNRFSNIFFQKRPIEKNVCNKCEYVSLCSGGCPAKAYGEYKSINAPDSDCIYGKKLMEKL